MERGELGTNRDGWFYTGRLWYEQGQEEPGPLSSDGEGEEHDEEGTCCDCTEEETCEKDCCGEHCCRKSN